MIEPQQKGYENMGQGAKSRDSGATQIIALNHPRFVKLIQWVAFTVLASMHTYLASKGISSSNYPVLGINSILLYAYLAFDIVACKLARYNVLERSGANDKVAFYAISRARLMREIARRPNLQAQLAMPSNQIGDSESYIKWLRLARVGQAMAAVHVVANVSVLWLQNPAYSTPETSICLLLSLFVLIYTSRIVSTRVDAEHEALKTITQTIKLPHTKDKYWSLEIDPILWREYYRLRISKNIHRVYDPAFAPSFILRALMEVDRGGQRPTRPGRSADDG